MPMEGAMEPSLAYRRAARLIEDLGAEAQSHGEQAVLRAAADALLFGDDDATLRFADADVVLLLLEQRGSLDELASERLRRALLGIRPHWIRRAAA
jgi:hypothetical protein